MRAKAADGASRLGLGARGVFYKVNLNLFESYLEICTNEAPTVGTARKCLGLRLGRPAASIPDSLIEACFFLREIRFNESPQKALEAFDLKKKDLWLLPTPRGPKIVEGPRRL